MFTMVPKSPWDSTSCQPTGEEGEKEEDKSGRWESQVWKWYPLLLLTFYWSSLSHSDA